MGKETLGETHKPVTGWDRLPESILVVLCFVFLIACSLNAWWASKDYNGDKENKKNKLDLVSKFSFVTGTALFIWFYALYNLTHHLTNNVDFIASILGRIFALIIIAIAIIFSVLKEEKYIEKDNKELIESISGIQSVVALLFIIYLIYLLKSIARFTR